MKHNQMTFIEYDDNNIDHIKYGPDYGNLNGKMKWLNSSNKRKPIFTIINKYKIYNIINIK